MIIPAQPFAPETDTPCIHCGEVYDHRIGGIVWNGYYSAIAKDTFICGNCAKDCVPALVNDLMKTEDWWKMKKRRAQYILDAAKKIEQMLPFME